MRHFLWTLIILALGLNLPSLVSAAASANEESGDRKDSNYFLPPDTIEKKIKEERAFKNHGKKMFSEIDVSGDAADDIRIINEANGRRVVDDENRKLPLVIDLQNDEDNIEVAKFSKKGKKTNLKEKEDIANVAKTKSTSDFKSTKGVVKSDPKKKPQYDSDEEDYDEEEEEYDGYSDGYEDGSDDEYDFDEEFYGVDEEDYAALYVELYGDDDYNDAEDYVDGGLEYGEFDE